MVQSYATDGVRKPLGLSAQLYFHSCPKQYQLNNVVYGNLFGYTECNSIGQILVP